MASPRRKPRASAVRPYWREKLLGRRVAPVPQTDTGRRGGLSAGDRETLCQGIRQIGPVTSGEGAPFAVYAHAAQAGEGRRESAQPTVYQKHRSPPSREATYGG